MSKEKKEEIVNRLEELLCRSSIVILTDYRGMPVSELTQLRRKLGELGVEYHVVKNSLTHLAAKKAGKEGMSRFLQGPTAIAFGSGGVTEPAKGLADYIRSTKSVLRIKGGLLGERVLGSEEVLNLSRLPSRDALIAQLIGGIQAPILSLQYVLSANLRGFVTALQARVRQLEGG